MRARTAERRVNILDADAIRNTNFELDGEICFTRED
jgi:hypothetical protein